MATYIQGILVYYIQPTKEDSIREYSAEELSWKEFDILFSWVDRMGYKHPKYLDEYTKDLMKNVGVLRSLKIESIRYTNTHERSHVPVKMWKCSGVYFTRKRNAEEMSIDESGEIDKVQQIECWIPV